MRAPASTWRARWKTISLAAAQTPRRGTPPPARYPVKHSEKLFRQKDFFVSCADAWPHLQPPLRRPLPQRKRRPHPGPPGVSARLWPARGLGGAAAMAHSGDRVWLWPEFPGDLGRVAGRPAASHAAAFRINRSLARECRRPAARHVGPPRAGAAGRSTAPPVVGPAAGRAPPAF